MQKRIDFEKGKIGYFNYGAGAPIILLHGYLETSMVWDDFIRDLADEFRVLAIDLPGHGESWIYGHKHTMEFMADAVLAVMDAEKIDRAFICGHSMGGYVALAFLEKYPSRLYAYCLFHSHPFADTQEAITNREREMRVVEAGKKDIIYPVNVPKMFADKNLERFRGKIERHKEIASGIPDKGIIAVLNGMISRPSRKDILEKGEVPLLLIAGRYDNYIPLEQIKESIQLPDNAEMIVLERSGHLGFVEEKEKSLEALRSFYNKILD